MNQIILGIGKPLSKKKVSYVFSSFFDNGFPVKLFDSCLARFLSNKFSDNSDVLRTQDL